MSFKKVVPLAALAVCSAGQSPYEKIAGRSMGRAESDVIAAEQPTVVQEAYVETKEDIDLQEATKEGAPLEADEEDDFDFEEYFDDADWDDYYDEEDYYSDDEEGIDQEQEEREAYAQHLRNFMDDFEPSDQLTTEIEAHAT